MFRIIYLTQNTNATNCMRMYLTIRCVFFTFSNFEKRVKNLPFQPFATPSALPVPAIEDAKVNSAINGIDNTVFYAGDMKKVLDNDFIARNGRPDVIILDPPRAGVDEPVIEVILNAAPKRIVYVSCNPATQARDLALMSSMYKVASVQPVDMFPHTHHVENVVKLEKIE